MSRFFEELKEIYDLEKEEAFERLAKQAAQQAKKTAERQNYSFEDITENIDSLDQVFDSIEDIPPDIKNNIENIEIVYNNVEVKQEIKPEEMIQPHIIDKNTSDILQTLSIQPKEENKTFIKKVIGALAVLGSTVTFGSILAGIILIVEKDKNKK